MLDLVSEVSSMWNFCARSSDVILLEGGGGGPVKCRLFSPAVFVSPVLFVQKCPLWVDSYANELNCKQLTLATICLNQRQRLMFKNYHHLRTKSIFLVC